MVLTKDDNVVGALSTNGTDDALAVGIHLRALPGGEHSPDAETLNTSLELLSVNAVAIVDEKIRCGIVGERLDDLLSPCLHPEEFPGPRA